MRHTAEYRCVNGVCTLCAHEMQIGQVQVYWTQA